MCGKMPYTVRQEESMWVVEDDAARDGGTLVVTRDKGVSKFEPQKIAPLVRFLRHAQL